MTVFTFNMNSHSANAKNTLPDFMELQGYTMVQVKKLSSGHLIIEVELNDQYGRFILDTGAGCTIVEEKRAQRFKLEASHSELTASGAGGSNISLQYSKTNKLVIQGYQCRDLNLSLMSLDHINDALTKLEFQEIDGIIGGDILTSEQAIIDYSNLSLYLKN